MVVVIVAREFFVNDSRGYFESKGISFAAEAPGKTKLLLQCVSVSFLLFELAFEDTISGLRGQRRAALARGRGDRRFRRLLHAEGHPPIGES